MLPAMTSEWDAAVAAVRAGRPPRRGRRGLVDLMTDDERHGCLDGDLPFWAGMADMGTRRLPQAPVPRRAGPSPGHPRVRVQRRATRRRGRQRHLLPGHHGPRGDLGRRPRGAHRRRHRPRAARRRRRPLRRRVRERAPPPGVGPRPGDLRRGPPPPRRAGRRPHPGGATPRHGHAEALRLQLDGERPLHGRRHRRRGGAPRGLPPPLQADRRRGRGLRDERLQRGQRRVVRAEPDPPHRRPPRRVGLRRLRDQRLDLRPPRRRTVDHRRARRRDARPHDPTRRPP